VAASGTSRKISRLTGCSSGASKPMGGQLEHRRHGRLQALDAAMGNGHAMAQTGGAQAFAGEQAVGDQRAGQTVQALKQNPASSKARFLLVASTLTST
jgi:hypothetical protein